MRRKCTICSSRTKGARSSTPSAAPGREPFELVLVRHGRTAWNAAGKYQGHSDIPLDDTGRAQAAGVGRELARLAFDYAVTSDLARARETAEIVLAPRAVALCRDPRWREMNFGVWEGLTRTEIVATRVAIPQGGESFGALRLRVADALQDVRERTPAGGRALVATHAGPLHAALRELLGEEATALGVTFSPASYTILRVGPGAATLLALNRTAG